MTLKRKFSRTLIFLSKVAIVGGGVALAQPPEKKPSSYMPVNQTEPLAAVIAHMKAEKTTVSQST